LNDTELETGNAKIENADQEDIHFNGSWENKNRSIAAAAFTGLIGIGAIYFNVQSLLVTIFTAFYGHVFHIQVSGNFLERMNEIVTQLKVPILIALVITQYGVMLYPTIWIVSRWHTTDVKKYLRIRLCSAKEIILAVFITISLLPFCYYLSHLVLQAFKVPDIYSVGSSLFTADSVPELILMIFIVAVTPAICEETLFRGYFQRTMERKIGAKSFILTGIIFGLFHMQPLSLVALSVLGMLFSFFYYRSKSIFPSSASHFTNNLVAVLILYTQTKGINIGLPLDGNIPLLWLIISLLVASGLFTLYMKTTSHSLN
jgi:membrane protease YdiL (CAAX protease family)